MTRHFLAIGECMVEMAPAGDDGLYRLGFAGDTFNTAWYARRMFGGGWEIAYFTAVGEDDLSRQMTGFITEAGISTGFIRAVPGRSVGLYLIRLKDGERSFAYWRSDSAARRLAADPAVLGQALGSADAVYFSGITLAILPRQDRAALLDAIAAARARGATVAFDPNLRPLLWEDPDTMRQTIMTAAGMSDILLPSFDDEAQAFGDAGPADTARRYGEAGAPLVVVKNGPGEVVSRSGGAIARYAPARVATVVDTTAAGDSFNAGFLARYLETRDLPASIAAAAALAAKVIQSHGALVDCGPAGE